MKAHCKYRDHYFQKYTYKIYLKFFANTFVPIYNGNALNIDDSINFQETKQNNQYHKQCNSRFPRTSSQPDTRKFTAYLVCW